MEEFEARCQEYKYDVISAYKDDGRITIVINEETVYLSTADAKRLADFIYKHIGE